MPLQCDSCRPATAFEIDACEPVIGAARHYDWRTAVSCGGSAPAGDSGGLEIDVVLLPETPLAESGAGTGVRVGGGLTAGVWGSALPVVDRAPLRYGAIPPQADPETAQSVLRAPGA